MIGPKVQAAIRDAVHATRARIAAAPDLWTFADEYERLAAIASLVADAVLDIVKPELVAHVPRWQLVYLAQIEIAHSQN